MSDNLNTDPDIDIWRYGRNAANAGRLDIDMLKSTYPYIQHTLLELSKVYKILNFNFIEEGTGRQLFLVKTKDRKFMEHYVFFQTKEDAELFKALLYIY